MAHTETGKLQMTTVNSIWHKDTSSFAENKWVFWSIWDVSLFSHIILSQFYMEEALSNTMQSSELSNCKQKCSFVLRTDGTRELYLAYKVPLLLLSWQVLYQIPSPNIHASPGKKDHIVLWNNFLVHCEKVSL